MSERKLVWIDLETTGLDPAGVGSQILEMAVIVTDAAASREEMIFHGGSAITAMTKIDEEVRQMHEDSGLLPILRREISVDMEVYSSETDLLMAATTGLSLHLGRPNVATFWPLSGAELAEADPLLGDAEARKAYYKVAPLIAGSSVHFDVRWLSSRYCGMRFLRLMHYRQIDVSGVREFLRCAGLWAGEDNHKPAHRAIDDLWASIDLYRKERQIVMGSAHDGPRMVY